MTDIYRYPVYLALRPTLSWALQPGDGRPRSAAEISGATLRTVFGWPAAQVTELRRPAFDLMGGPIRAEWQSRFNLVFADFVLEHVSDPVAALRSLAYLAASGGRVVVTTAFLFPIHGSEVDNDMIDYYRFSPKALDALFYDVGDFSTWETHGWGNEQAASAALRWQQNNGDSVLGQSLIEAGNDPRYPVLTWASGVVR